MRDGEPLDTDLYAYDEASGSLTLTIPSAKPSDSGSYTITLENTCGKTSACFDVDVKEKKKKKKLKIDGQATSELEAKEEQVTSELKVEEIVTEEITEEDDKFKKQKGLGPKFDLLPQPMIVNEGEKVRITCAVSGSISTL